LLQVPWELSYDGEQFVALKFRVGRQVITSSAVPHPPAARQAQGPLRVLMIADPTETLPQAAEEVERLCELLGRMRGVEVTLLGGQAVRKVPLLAALEAHDVYSTESCHPIQKDSATSSLAQASSGGQS